MGVHKKLTGAERTAKYRAARRAQGLRLKQLWVPDLRNPKVLAGIRREVEAINRSEDEAAIMRTLEGWNEELHSSLPPYEREDGQPGSGAAKRT